MLEILEKLGMLEDNETIPDSRSNLEDIIVFVERLFLYNSQEVLQKFVCCLFDSVCRKEE